MKKCPVCGARNRDRFEDCIRCGEPMVPESPSRLRAASGIGLAGVAIAVLGLAGLAFRWIAMGAESEEPASSAVESVSGGEPAASIPDGILSAEEMADAIRQAMGAYEVGDYETALETFDALARVSPSNSIARLYTGLCKSRLGDLKGATVSLRQAVKLDSSNELAVENLVPLLVELGSTAEAEALQIRLVTERPMDAGALIELGRIHTALGKMDLAMEVHRRAVAVSSSSPESLLALGATLNEARRPGEAIEIFQQIIQSDAQVQAAHAGMGVALVLARRYTEAIASLEEAVRLDPQQAPVRLSLAAAYERLDRIEDSLREYEAFVELTSEPAMAARISRLVERARAAQAEKQ